MLFNSYQLLFSDPVAFVQLTVVVVISLLLAVTIHEFSHALVATVLGDDTSRRLGRLSLNPLRHLDPGGTIMLLLAGFGWGKPVPVDHHRLPNGAFGMAMVAAAGPLANLTLAFLVAVPIKLGLLGLSSPALGRANLVMTGGWLEGLTDIAWMVIFFNLLLAVFNLIPLAPLDGSRVLGGILPRQMMTSYDRFQRYGPVVLLTVILADLVFNLGILSVTIGPIVNGLVAAATGF